MTEGPGPSAAEALRELTHVHCNFWIAEDVSATPSEELPGLVAAGHGSRAEYARQIALYRSAENETKIVTVVKRGLLYGTLTEEYSYDPTPAVDGHPHLRGVSWDAAIVRGKKVDTARRYDNLVWVEPSQIVGSAR